MDRLFNVSKSNDSAFMLFNCMFIIVFMGELLPLLAAFEYSFIVGMLASINDEPNNKIKAGGNSQKLILFNRGNAISGAPIYNGRNQLPNPQS